MVEDILSPQVFLTLLGVIVIPVVTAFIKMHNQLKVNENRILSLENLKQEHDDLRKRLMDTENEISGIRVKIQSMDEIIGRVRDYVLKEKKRKDDEGLSQ